ncbi:cell division protein FtsA [bacterium]|nr:cell division protein FtsA [bacterium]
MAGSSTILGIDIGSTKITTVVGELHSSRGLILRGLNSVPTNAISRGVIRDLNQAAKDIDESYSGAMYSSGLSLDQAFVGITGRDLASENFEAVLEISHPDGEVGFEDVDLVVERALPAQLQQGRQIVQTMVRGFTLDGIKTSGSPIGMIGSQLGVETHVVTGPQSQVANLERALGRVEMKINSFVHNLIASGEAVLTSEEKNAGCVLIDFGGGTTSVGVFLGGALSHFRCIPIGGMSYDHDLKQGLGISFDEAQRIKKSHGKAWIDAEDEELDDLIDVKYYGRREYDKVKRRRIYDIMQPRTEELLEHILYALHESGQVERVAGGVVIVGGACQLRQLRSYLQRHLQRQVRVGLPAGVGHLLDEYRAPAYVAALGLLIYGSTFGESTRGAEPSFLGEVVEAMGDMIRGLFRRSER